MKKVLVTTAVITCGVAVLAAPAVAVPPGQGCPGGQSDFALWDVSAEPYGVDNYVDEKGNNDGLACAKPTFTVLDDNGEPFQIYNFLDNQFRPNG